MSQHPTRRALLRGTAAATGLVIFGEGAANAQTGAAQEFDVVVIGAGAAGMVAALTAAKRGLSTLVVEKAAKFGGSAARSGAGIWVPGNETILAAGVPDTPAKAAAYLSAVVSPSGVPAAKQAAFLAAGPAMISFVVRHSPLRFRWMEGYSDYYPELPGGMPGGRSIEPDLFDGNLLGPELANLNPAYIPVPAGEVIFSADYKWLNLALVNAKGAAVALEGAARWAAAKARGVEPLTMGQALAGALRAGLAQAGVPVWLNTPLTDLRVEAGRVTGALVSRNGAQTLLRARRGVILASGGFEHDGAMRTQYQEQPIGTDWTVGADSNTGDGHRAGLQVGAAVEFMDDAWWGPSIPVPGEPYFCLAERTLPGSLIVNQAGRRFVNEAAPYSDVVHVMYAQDAIPAWLVIDQNYRNRYLFKDIPPTLDFPGSWYAAGAVVKSWTWNGLAAKMGVPASAFTSTLLRFNTFAFNGRDLDFRRGDSVYDHYFTDPAVAPNSCLAPLLLPPFYALKIVPGDLGTKGGLATDVHARVLSTSGAVIPGLYAAGNASSPLMGRSYAGAGSTLGPAMTFGHIAANHV
ncbi:3-oxosteroid 1-dehydrogenase [Nonomuraea typhae]|uniref:3-oxosteroid 1-dehydrogenase n=1 Tax=Nonomuraea typhae TaxID=2603600 RepID=A0ABW7ZA91_9ACTN